MCFLDCNWGVFLEWTSSDYILNNFIITARRTAGKTFLMAGDWMFWLISYVCDEVTMTGTPVQSQKAFNHLIGKQIF